jgi:hypothetical protein
MTASQRTVLLGLAGAGAGTLNAWLCYAKWPVPVTNVSFHWHVIPAGFAHGGLLAVTAMAAALLAAKLHPSWRYAALPVAGWVGGYLSWIPLQMSVFEDSFTHALVWPVANGDSALQGTWAPFFHFGLVSALYYAWLMRRSRPWQVWAEVIAASCAGVFGSLWWWSSMGTWYFSPLHGIAWGCLVGSAVSLTKS